VVNVRSSVSFCLFLACFFVNSFWGRKESFIFFRGDDIFIQTKDARLRKEERRKKSERTLSERERERSVVFSYIYLFVVYSLFLLERKREFLPLLSGRKKASFGRA